MTTLELLRHWLPTIAWCVAAFLVGWMGGRARRNERPRLRVVHSALVCRKCNGPLAKYAEHRCMP